LSAFRDAADNKELTGYTGWSAVPQRVRRRLFEPFATTKKSGLGLGLSICRSIAAAHGGRQWAENRPEGGAAFHIILPPFATSQN
jgi:signal transduction histidine kinase